MHAPRMQISVGYHFEKGDPLGTWRVVATLDDVPLSEELFEVMADHEVH